MADVDPPLGQEILDVALRQRVLHVHHHDQTDHFWRAVEISERTTHGLKLPQPKTSQKIALTVPPGSCRASHSITAKPPIKYSARKIQAANQSSVPADRNSRAGISAIHSAALMKSACRASGEGGPRQRRLGRTTATARSRSRTSRCCIKPAICAWRCRVNLAARKPISSTSFWRRSVWRGETRLPRLSSALPLPSLFCRFLRNVRAPLGRHPCRSGRAAFLAERLRRQVLAVVRAVVLRLLARRNAHDFDGVADDIGGTLLAFRAGGHFRPIAGYVAANYHRERPTRYE